MKAIVIKRKLDAAEIKELFSFIGNSDDYKVYSEIKLPEEFNGLKIEEYNTDYIPKRKINYETMQLVNDFGDKIINGKEVSEHLSFEKAGIWHYHKFRIYFSVLNVLYELFEINYFSNKFETVEFYTACRDIKLYKNLPLNVGINVPKKRNNGINFKSLFNYSLFILLRTIISFFKINHFRNVKHVVIDHTIRQNCIDINTFKEKKDNYNLSYLFERLDFDFIILREIFIPKFKDTDTFRLHKEYFLNDKKLKRIFSDFVVFKALLNHKIRNQRKLIQQQLVKSYNLIQSVKLSPEEVMIIKYLKLYHKVSSYYILKYLAYQKFFSKHKIKTISTIDENSAIIKTILDAAKSQNIKTIGIQHGNIHELHPAYMFTKTDYKNKVMSDFTLLWGKYYKSLLIEKGNYPEESLIIAGQIRTDIIPALNSNNLSAISQDLKIKIQNSKHTILFASQPQRDIELRHKAAYDVFTSVKDNPEILLIIKLHPNELNDVDYYKKIATEAGCSNFFIIYYIDLYLLLSISDIVITCFSTVGSEAVYFNKPFIVLDHLNQDIQRFHESGVAFQATNADELKDYIFKILSGKLNINKEAYDKFVENYAYKIDGKVSERCIEFIKSLN
jgi:CDP-glycerol glycerophosphotransferase (TagB/SpsB family)